VDFQLDSVLISVIELLFYVPIFSHQVILQEVCLVVVRPFPDRQFLDHQHIVVYFIEQACGSVAGSVHLVDFTNEAPLPWLHFDDVFAIQQPLDVIDQVLRVEVWHIGGPAGANALRAVDQHHGDDRHEEFGFDHHAVVFALF